MGRRYSRMDRNVNDLFDKYDSSALTFLFILCLIGLWPIAVLLVVFGFIGSLFNEE